MHPSQSTILEISDSYGVHQLLRSTYFVHMRATEHLELSDRLIANRISIHIIFDLD